MNQLILIENMANAYRVYKLFLFVRASYYSDCRLLYPLNIEYEEFSEIMASIQESICSMMINHPVPQTKPAVIAFAAIQKER